MGKRGSFLLFALLTGLTFQGCAFKGAGKKPVSEGQEVEVLGSRGGHPPRLEDPVVLPNEPVTPPEGLSSSLARSGDTKTIPFIGGQLRVMDVTASTRSEYYFVSHGRGQIGGVFIAPDGSTLASAKINDSTEWAESPKAAYNPDNDSFLVAWADNRKNPDPDIVRARIVQVKNRAFKFLTADFVVSGVVGVDPRNPLAAAFSTVSKEYLVAWPQWSGDGLRVLGQRISSGGELLGSAITIFGIPAWYEAVHIAYNQTDDEFMVTVATAGTAGTGDPTALIQRVKPGTGTLLGSVRDIGAYNALWIPQLAYNAWQNEYLLVFSAGDSNSWSYRHIRLSNSGQPLSAAASFGMGFTNDSMQVAYNRISNTYFATFPGENEEVYGQEISAAGQLGPVIQVTSVDAPNVGRYTPAIGASAFRGEWFSIASLDYKSLIGQKIVGAR